MVKKISHAAGIRRTPMLGANPNKWKITPATKAAPKPLHTSIKICTMRSGTDIFMLPRCDHAKVPPKSCAAVAASDPPSNPTWRSNPTIIATGKVRIWPNSRPAKYGIPTTTRVYAMNIFMALAAERPASGAARERRTQQAVVRLLFLVLHPVSPRSFLWVQSNIPTRVSVGHHYCDAKRTLGYHCAVLSAEGLKILGCRL